jgi:hypothetical protein
MIELWRPTRYLGFRVLGTNIFLIEFEHSWDKSQVLEGRPWLFQGHVFTVEEFDGRTLPSKIAFERCLFGYVCLTAAGLYVSEGRLSTWSDCRRGGGCGDE